MADCPSCGGFLKFDIPTQKVKCEFCQSSMNPEDVSTTQMADETQMEVTEFYCPNCGGQIYSTDKDITGVCTYCGSNMIFESRLVQKRRPDLIIPFQKTKQDCKDLYMAKVGKSWFVPKALKDPEFIDEFRGIYMPYWVADVKQKGNIRYYATSSKTYNEASVTDVNRISGGLDVTYKGLYHDAASGFSDDISEKLEPFLIYDKGDDRHSNARPFYPAYLSGFYGEPADVDAEAYQEYFDDIANRQTEAYLSAHPLLKQGKVKKFSEDEFGKLDLMSDLRLSDAENTLRAIAPTGHKLDFGLLNEHSRVQSQREREAEKQYRQLKSEKKQAEKVRKQQAENVAKVQGKNSEELQAEKVRKQKPDKAEQLQSEKKGTFLLGEQMDVETSQDMKLGMFPVWFMAYRNKDRVVYATVNGQTGRVNVDLPIDFKQFLKVFVVIFAILFAIFSLMTIRSYAMALMAVCFSGLTIHMSYCELLSILDHSKDEVVHSKRQKLKNSATVGVVGLIILTVIPLVYAISVKMEPDLSVMTNHGCFCVYSILGLIYTIVMTVKATATWGKIKGKEKSVPSFLLATLAAVLGTILVLTNNPSDALLYGVAALAMVCIALTMLTVVRQYNRVATRPLPQFEHKGGDDRA